MSKCRYCGKELIEEWCSCEKFLVNEKGVEPIVPLTETKGKKGGRNSSSLKVASLDSFNLSRFQADKIEPIRFFKEDEL